MPVDWVALEIPQYPQQIKYPMDIGTAKLKLLNREYDSPDEFAADVRVTAANCKSFNRQGSPIYKAAEQLEKIFEAKWAKMGFSSENTKKRKAVKREEEPSGTSSSEDEEEFAIHESSIVCDYERKRQENIERNQQMIHTLGLSDLVTPTIPVANNMGHISPKKFKPADPRKHTIKAPTRASKRKKGFEYTSLFNAVREKDVDEVFMLLSPENQDEIAINAPNGINEETALHLAATIGDAQITELILQHPGVDVNAQDLRGWTPLYIAQLNRFKDIVTVLQNAGASPIEAYAERKQLRPTATTWTPTTAPLPSPEQNRCTCCHTCRTSLTIHPREHKGCSTCPYIVCKNCFNSKGFLSSTWDEVSKNSKWVCDVCIGTCVCSRCSTRGPPRWFGHQNPKWKNSPTTVKRSAPPTRPKEKKEISTSPKTPVSVLLSCQSPSPNRAPSPDLTHSLVNHALSSANELKSPQCSCCHICRKSVTVSQRPYKSCSTCPYIICDGCFGSRISQTWQDANKASDWSCTVCHGSCVCTRCKNRGPPAWFGQLKKAKGKNLHDNQSVLGTITEEPQLLPLPSELNTDLSGASEPRFRRVHHEDDEFDTCEPIGMSELEGMLDSSFSNFPSNPDEDNVEQAEEPELKKLFTGKGAVAVFA